MSTKKYVKKVQEKKTDADEKNDTMILHLVYFFLAAFSADFVTRRNPSIKLLYKIDM